MKITIKTGITALVLLLVYSCTKESLSTPIASNAAQKTASLSTPITAAQKTASRPTSITINSVYDLSSYPFHGTFYTHGALEIEGTVIMEVYHPNAIIFHCVYTFVAPQGTFIIHEECVYATPLEGQGRWEIVSGTGAYTNLKGNGSALMPGNQENWVGFIY